MGIPFVGNLGGHDDSSVEDRTGAAVALSSESAEKSLEDKAKRALDCPCVADLRDGPCGEQFSAAFVCFIKSQAPEKGSECLDSFTKMQNCMSANSESFMSQGSVADDEGKRMPTDKDNSSTGGAENGSAGSAASESEAVLPPEVPKAAIRFPPWYIKKVVKESR